MCDGLAADSSFQACVARNIFGATATGGGQTHGQHKSRRLANGATATGGAATDGPFTCFRNSPRGATATGGGQTDTLYINARDG